MLSRRHLIGALCLTLPPLAGCGQHPRSRSLELHEFDVTGESDTGYELGFSVRVPARTNGADRWSVFHDVAVVGYDRSNSVLCRSNVGTIAAGESEEDTVSCPKIPPFLTLIAEETPCDPDTYIGIYEYVGGDSDALYRERHDRNCDEGKFPDP